MAIFLAIDFLLLQELWQRHLQGFFWESHYKPAAACQTKCCGPSSEQIKQRERECAFSHKWWGSAASPFLGEFMSGAHAREHGELLSQKQMLLIPTQKPPHSPALQTLPARWPQLNPQLNRYLLLAPNTPLWDWLRTRGGMAGHQIHTNSINA